MQKQIWAYFCKMKNKEAGYARALQYESYKGTHKTEREWKILCTHNINFSVSLQTWLGGDRSFHLSGGPYILK